MKSFSEERKQKTDQLLLTAPISLTSMVMAKFLAAYTMFLIAHEMRHYYQMRQLDADNPIEDVKTLEEWRENDQNPKYPGEDCSIFEFYMQPMELDAELFAYVLVASKFDVLVSVDFIDENLLKEMEKHYVRLFGETNNELFSNEDA